MSHTAPLVAANRTPTTQEIAREGLYLDAYGMAAAKLLSDYPVNIREYVSKQDVLNPLIDTMAEDGWAFEGSGFFSAVFIKGGLALKFGFKVNDTGAMYAAWCRANQGKAGVPAIYGITKFSSCYLVLTRRYDKVRSSWLREDSGETIPELRKEFQAIASALNQGKFWGVKRFDTVKTAAAIREFFSDVADFDLHESNVMMDGQGELVITDPISYGTCSGRDTSYYEYTTT